jgi:hypothetical protein
MWKKYKSIKPPIEAILVTKDTPIREFDRHPKIEIIATLDKVWLEIETLEGKMIANEGDYIIKGINDLNSLKQLT